MRHWSGMLIQSGGSKPFVVSLMEILADEFPYIIFKMGGFVGPPQLTPFAKASITSFWSDEPFKTYRTGGTDVLGTLFLINGGNKPTGKWKLRVWLSSDATLNTSGAVSK